MFWRAAILLPLVRWSLRLRGYGKTFASLKKRVHFQASGVVNPPGSQDELVRAGCRMVRAALRYSFANYTCLEESLTLWCLLRRQGVAAGLRIGVRKEGGIFEAHAWVEIGGAALNQDGAMHRHYSAFERELTEPPMEQP